MNIPVLLVKCVSAGVSQMPNHRQEYSFLFLSSFRFIKVINAIKATNVINICIRILANNVSRKQLKVLTLYSFFAYTH